jgi:hypothetical protein
VLLALARAAFLGSESLGTRDHISQLVQKFEDGTNTQTALLFYEPDFLLRKKTNPKINTHFSEQMNYESLCLQSYRRNVTTFHLLRENKK